jgi:hypothetical protein
MRKRLLTDSVTAPAATHGVWLDLAQLATVEVSSEDPQFPIEAVFTNDGEGWRATKPGEQHICLIFDEPVSVRHIQLKFHEPAAERTQEFTLRWSPARGGPAIEIVRQQWNFSPTGSTTELEEYAVSLENVSALELTIRPDIGRKDAVATLAAWRVG